jgi:glycosyltransferase involved in cell wall biosynthesis/GT2 family glycosyltransferase
VTVSLITVTYNGGASIVGDLRGIAQIVGDEVDEFLVVDSGSTDATAERIGDELSEVRLIAEPQNRGYASAVNRGIAEATGDVLVILNPDAFPEAGAVERLGQIALEHPEFLLLGGTLVDVTGRAQRNGSGPLPRLGDVLREGIFLPRPKVAGFERIAAGGPGVVEAGFISGAVMAILRRNLEELGPMDDDYFLYNEDVEWCHRAWSRGGRVGIVPSARFEHAGGATTREAERDPFAARVLSDFQYHVEVRGVAAELVRRRWLLRTRFRSWLYGADAKLKILGGRPNSAERARNYRDLHRALRLFRWSTDANRQNGLPSRLFERPTRPRVVHLITRLIVGGAQENTVASVEQVDPARFESRLWMGPQTGDEGSLVDDARRRGIAPQIIPNLVRQIHPLKDLLVTAELARRFRRERVDLVHTHSSKAGIVGRLAAWIAGVPVIVHTVHGWGFHEHMSPFVRGVYVFLERLMQGFTDRLISVSEETTRIGLERAIGVPEKYTLIRSGIPLARFHPDDSLRRAMRHELGILEGEIVIGSVGRLSPQKNPLDFVRVARQLLSTHPHLRFLYVGDGALRPEFEAAAGDSPIPDRITLLGLRDDVPDLLRALDIFVLTSLWEGLPRVVPQALSTGVPVVVYNISGVEEIVTSGHNGYVVPPRDLEAMVDRLRHLIEDDRARAEMSRRARAEFDSSFSEEAMIRQLGELYDELLAAR